TALHAITVLAIVHFQAEIVSCTNNGRLDVAAAAWPIAAGPILPASAAGDACAQCFAIDAVKTVVVTAKPRPEKNFLSFSRERSTRLRAASSLIPKASPTLLKG